MRPGPTPSRPCPRLSTPLSTPSARLLSESPLPPLTPPMLPPPLPWLTPLMLDTPLPPLPWLTPLMLDTPLPPLLWPKLPSCVAAITKYLSIISVTGLNPCWSVTDRVTCHTCHSLQTDTCGHVNHVSWWLLLLYRRRNASNVLVTPLQYDILHSKIRTSGTYFVMLNVLLLDIVGSYLLINL